MKTFLYTLATFVACAMAQDINSLPACERTCIESMLQEGPNYGCPNTDNGGPSAACLCSKTEFAYGVRDCSTESCPDGTDINQVTEYGLQYCQSAQASASGTSLAAIALFSAGASSSTSSAASASSDASATSSSSSGEPISTVPVVSTLTSDGSTIESTVGSSTVFSSETASSTSGSESESSSASATAVSTSAIVSTVSDSSTTRTTTVGSTTVFSSSSSEGAGPTMGPPRLLPRFGGQQADIKDPFWIVRALAYTGMLMFAVQLAWVYGGAW